MATKRTKEDAGTVDEKAQDAENPGNEKSVSTHDASGDRRSTRARDSLQPGASAEEVEAATKRGSNAHEPLDGDKEVITDTPDKPYKGILVDSKDDAFNSADKTGNTTVR